MDPITRNVYILCTISIRRTLTIGKAVPVKRTVHIKWTAPIKRTVFLRRTVPIYSVIIKYLTLFSIKEVVDNKGCVFLYRWKSDVEGMIGRKISIWLKICWAYITPMLTLGLLISAIINYEPLVYNKTYIYPLFGQLLGGALALSSIIFVPLYFFYALITAPGVKIAEVTYTGCFFDYGFFKYCLY